MLTTLIVAALAFYVAGFGLRWRQLQHTAAAHDQATPGTMINWLTLGAIALHAAATYQLMFTPQGFNISLVAVSNAVALVMVVFVAVGNLRLPVANLYLLLFPISVTALAAAVLTPASSADPGGFTPVLITHILVSLGAYSILMMAACQSALLAVQEHQLKNHTLRPGKLLPPLESMERLLLGMLWIGLILLTAAIISGFAFLENMFAQQVVHHTVLTSLSWLVYAFFLGGRYLFGWRGLTTVRWTLVAFALLLLGYFGSKFVLEYLVAP
ncbi:MAG: cytochrome c biogenesis protein CcsA [Pseudomonadota bacterium]